MRINSSKVRALAASVFTAGTLIALSAPPASAAPTVTFRILSATDMGWSNVMVIIDGHVAGTGSWAGDPGDQGSSTGDTIIAHDSATDGYGIEVTLDGTRVATTRGHNAPYTDRASGNLKEDSKHTMRVCAVKGSYAGCTTIYNLKA
ncbi:hypothetical protein [Streptomyces sp. NPDC058861]|uniref:hypothetical protein n=1 Tax=Streptomyces sp. NPDC058861 TaxID=3346653 RepID=UPI003690DF08